MSGISVRDLTRKDAQEYLFLELPMYDVELELQWSLAYREDGWALIVMDDGGDVRFWRIVLGELGEELYT